MEDDRRVFREIMGERPKNVKYDDIASRNMMTFYEWETVVREVNAIRDYQRMERQLAKAELAIN